MNVLTSLYACTSGDKQLVCLSVCQCVVSQCVCVSMCGQSVCVCQCVCQSVCVSLSVINVMSSYSEPGHLGSHLSTQINENLVAVKLLQQLYNYLQ